MDDITKREPIKITAEDINPRYNWGRHLPVLGAMGVDFEERVDYRRMHRIYPLCIRVVSVGKGTLHDIKPVLIGKRNIVIIGNPQSSWSCVNAYNSPVYPVRDFHLLSLPGII